MKHRKPTLRQFLRSRTVWFAIAVATLSVLQGFVLFLPIDPHWQAAVGVAISVLIIYFRFITGKPLDDK